MNHHHQTLAPLKPVVEQPPLTLYFADVFQLQRSFPLLLYSGQRCCFLCSSVSLSSDHSLSMTAATTSMSHVCQPSVTISLSMSQQATNLSILRPKQPSFGHQSSHPLEITVSCIPLTFVPFNIVPGPFYIINQVVFKISP